MKENETEKVENYKPDKDRPRRQPMSDNLEQFFLELKKVFIEKPTHVFQRSMWGYVSPAHFYNHKSRTFMMNKRRGL